MVTLGFLNTPICKAQRAKAGGLKGLERGLGAAAQQVRPQGCAQAVQGFSQFSIMSVSSPDIFLANAEHPLKCRKKCFPEYSYLLGFIDRVKVVSPTRHNIGHFRDVLANLLA